MKTAEELAKIAENIIHESTGSFHMEWGEEYEKLSAEEQSAVNDIVYDQISDCADCGWNYAVFDMENIGGEYLCSRCEWERERAEEEDE